MNKFTVIVRDNRNEEGPLDFSHYWVHVSADSAREASSVAISELATDFADDTITEGEDAKKVIPLIAADLTTIMVIKGHCERIHHT